METKEIRRCIEHTGADKRPAIADGARRELVALEAQIAWTAQGTCGHNWDRREWDTCPVCAMKDGAGIRIANLEEEIRTLKAADARTTHSRASGDDQGGRG